MALSADLLSQFARVTNDKPEPKKESTAYGTAVIRDGKTYVKFDGSDLLTPVSTTTAVEENERVAVQIKNHTATITGNLSSPAARNSSVEDLSDQISEFEIVIADKISTKELDAQIARIDQLTTDNVTVKEKLTAAEAEIEELSADVADIDTLYAKKAEIDELVSTSVKAEIADFGFVSTEDLEATNADINNLEATYAAFQDATAAEFAARDALINNLEANKLSAEDIEGKYANIDFSNIGTAAIEEFYAKSGLIENIVVGDGTITGRLVGVTISGDLIEANTLKAEKLVVKGEDGLYYKLNVEAGAVASEEVTEEQLQNGLSGSVIIAKSITAEQISVHDLVAFDATIGGFNITDDSIYSGAKESVDNTTRGVYMDNDGQVAFGDASNYLKYYKAEDGSYKLEISADEITMGSKKLSLAVTEKARGNFIHLDDASDLPFVGMTVYGKSVQETKSGKNLLKDNVETGRTMYGVTFTKLDDGGYSVVGTATETAFLNLNYVDGNTCSIPNGDYILSGGKDGVKLYVVQDGSWLATNQNGAQTNITFNSTTNNWIRIQVDTGVTVDTVVYPMLRLATIEDDTFEPYCGGIPSPNPDYPEEITTAGSSGSITPAVKGKNLIWFKATQTKSGVTSTHNGDGTYTLSGTSTVASNIYYFGSGFSQYSYYNPIKRGTYTLSGCTTGSNAKYHLIARVVEPDMTLLVRAKCITEPVTFTVDSDTAGIMICLTFVSGFTFDNVVIKPQLEVGTVGTEFESYKGQSVEFATPDGLGSISWNVSWTEGDASYDSDGVLQLSDTLVCKADGTGEITRRTWTKVFDGTEAWAAYNTTTHPGLFYLTGITPYANGKVGRPVICSHYPYYSGELDRHLDECRFRQAPYTDTFYISTSTYTTVDELKAFLAEEYTNGTPVTVVYPLYEPIIKTLSKTEVNAFLALHTYKPISNIYTSDICDLEVEYVKADYSEALGAVYDHVGLLDIGSRNLLKDTSFEDISSFAQWNTSYGSMEKTDDGLKITNNGTGYNGIRCPLAVEGSLENDTEYTLSFKYRTNILTDTGSVYILQNTTPNVNVGNPAEPLVISETEWQEYKTTIKHSDISPRVANAVLLPYQNLVGWFEIKSKSLKLEKGAHTTDWTPAPEDIDDSIHTSKQELYNGLNPRLEETETAIKKLEDSISMLVTDENGASLMTQTSTGWTYSMSDVQNKVNDVSTSLKNLTDTVDTAEEAVAALEKAVQNLDEKTEHVHIGSYDGDPCIELYETGDDNEDVKYKLIITNKKVVFKEGSNEPVDISDGTLNADNVNVRYKIKHGQNAWIDHSGDDSIIRSGYLYEGA